LLTFLLVTINTDFSQIEIIKLTFHYFAMFAISSSIMKWNDNRVTNTFYKKIYIKNLFVPVGRLILLASLSVLQQSEAVAALAAIRTRRRYANVRAEYAFHELTDIIQLCESVCCVLKSHSHIGYKKKEKLRLRRHFPLLKKCDAQFVIFIYSSNFIRRHIFTCL